MEFEINILALFRSTFGGTDLRFMLDTIPSPYNFVLHLISLDNFVVLLRTYVDYYYRCPKIEFVMFETDNRESKAATSPFLHDFLDFFAACLSKSSSSGNLILTKDLSSSS